MKLRKSKVIAFEPPSARVRANTRDYYGEVIRAYLCVLRTKEAKEVPPIYFRVYERENWLV